MAFVTRVSIDMLIKCMHPKHGENGCVVRRIYKVRHAYLLYVSQALKIRCSIRSKISSVGC